VRDVTAEPRGRRRFEDQLSVIGATETFPTQIDLRVSPADADRLPFPLPIRPNTWNWAGSREIMWLGPDEWLLLADPDSREPGRQIAELENSLARVYHSVVDVSANRGVIDLAGPSRHELLSSACPIDLHPRSWGDGRCAQTVFGAAQILLQEREATTRVFVRPSFAAYVIDLLVAASES
jgi:sarcosine oxidase, subunit gamma